MRQDWCWEGFALQWEVALQPSPGLLPSFIPSGSHMLVKGQEKGRPLNYSVIQSTKQKCFPPFRVLSCTAFVK